MDPAALMQVWESYAPLVFTQHAAKSLSGLLPVIGSYYFSWAYVKKADALLQVRGAREMWG